uniref:EF-hand domain-containing protein n=1 Tax=Globodera rostochiensis TaxID=31243 RepID=A0A914H5E5_GLORO
MNGFWNLILVSFFATNLLEKTESVQLFDEIFGEGWWDNDKDEEWNKLTLERKFHHQIDWHNTQIGHIEPNSTDQLEQIEPNSTDQLGQIEPNSTDQLGQIEPNSTDQLEQIEPNSTDQLGQIKNVSSCEKTLFYDGCCVCCGTSPLFGCPKPFEPANCNAFDHNCVACNYIYNKTNECSERVQCSCYCCDLQYAESSPGECAQCVKDGEGGCPENSAAVNFKSIGNSLSSMLETEAKAWEHFDMIDVDKNGSISLNEAIDHLETKLKNGTSDKNLAKNVSWFAEMDSNGNNQIEPGEFDRSLIKVNNRTSG